MGILEQKGRLKKTGGERPKTPSDILALGALRKEMKNYCGLADRVTPQGHTDTAASAVKN